LTSTICIYYVVSNLITPQKSYYQETEREEGSRVKSRLDPFISEDKEGSREDLAPFTNV